MENALRSLCYRWHCLRSSAVANLLRLLKSLTCKDALAKRIKANKLRYIQVYTIRGKPRDITIEECITLLCPSNVDPLTPHFYIVKLVFTGVYIFFLIFALKHRLWVLVRTASLKTQYIEDIYFFLGEYQIYFFGSV